MSSSPDPSDSPSAPQESAPLAYQSPQPTDDSLAFVIGVIGLRLLGIYLMLTIISLASVGMMMMTQSALYLREPQFLAASTLPPVAYSLAGFFLFCRARSLAAKMFLNLPAGSTSISIPAMTSIMTVGIGMFLVVDALPQVVAQGVSLLMGNNLWGQGTSYQGAYSYTAIGLVPAACRLSLGVLLIMFSRRISGIWLARFG
jgi:hypothetical protein